MGSLDDIWIGRPCTYVTISHIVVEKENDIGCLIQRRLQIDNLFEVGAFGSNMFGVVYLSRIQISGGNKNSQGQGNE